jgi:hypothetical protein
VWNFDARPAAPVSTSLRQGARLFTNLAVDVNVKVQPGSALIAIEEIVKSLVARVGGMLNTNGAGSLGHSSPDAAALSPSTGAGSGASGSW